MFKAEAAAYTGSLNHIEPPRVRGEVRIPVQVEGRPQSTSYWNAPVQSYSSSSSSSYTARHQGAFSEPEIGISAYAPIPPTRYTGGHIPSRSFRLLQMMTGELDDFW